MKRRSIVAVVGRPNVGKSTLFNALAGEKAAIVKDTPGVTRDRLYRDVEWGNRSFVLADTGGIEPLSNDIIFSQMREQAQIAIDTADVILFMADVRSGVTDADAGIADMIRKSGRPVVLAVNKVDDFKRQEADVYEFYHLGLGEPYPISAEGRQGLGDLLEAVCALMPEKEEEPDDACARVAIIGRPNTGKSSLINRLTGENRLIVSDIAGTTRDAVDTEVIFEGNRYTFIDTAGLRRKSKIKEELERYMIIRAVSAIERADVCVLVLPCGRSAHAEAGWMKGKGKKTIVYMPEKQEAELMYRLFDGVVDSMEDLLGAI